MAQQELIQLIRQQLSAGVSPEQVKRTLLGLGLLEKDIDAGLAEVGPISPPPQQPTRTPQTLPPQNLPGTFVPLPSTSNVPRQGNISNVGAPRAANKKGALVLFFILIVLVVGGVGYAYYMNLGPFAHPPYSENNLVSGLLGSVSRINRSSYRISGSLAVGARDTDAAPIAINPNNQELVLKYKHDAKRAQDISTILQVLQRTKPYPSSLQTVASSIQTSYYGNHISLTDPVTNQQYGYKVTNGGANFALSVAFETDGAIAELRRGYNFSKDATPIAGKQVTFTKDSSSYMYFSSVPPKPLLAQLSEAVSSLPADVHADLSASAATDWTKEDADWKFNISAAGDFGDLTYKIDVDALKKAGTYYFKINNLPSLFLGSLATIKGQWIRVDADIASSSEPNYYDVFSSVAAEIPKAEKSYKEQRQQLTDALKKTAKIADEEHLFTIVNGAQSERINGRSLYRYTLTINKAALVPFYKRLLSEIDTSKIPGFTTLIADEGYVEYLQSSEFNEIFDYYNKNATLTLSVDTQGYPAIISYSLRVIPPDTASQLKDKQVNVVFKLKINDINGAVDITAPKDAKPIQDLINQPGQSGPAMKSRDARRIADTKQIQLALELYFDVNNGQYPTSLSLLTSKTSCGGSFCLPLLPTDRLDKTSYYYTYHTLNGKRDTYHLGASLEDDANYALVSDTDCNSRTNSDCGAKSGTWNTAEAFNGSDDTGCGGETGRYCYDVTP